MSILLTISGAAIGAASLGAAAYFGRRWFRSHRPVVARPHRSRTGRLFTAQLLCKSYPSPEGEVHAIRHARFQIGGGFVGILGESGSGKTTLLNMMGALDEPTSGHLIFQDMAVPYHDPAGLREYLRFRVAWVFQELNLIQHLSVVDNVALPLLCQGWRRDDARAAAREHLAPLDIEELVDRKPLTLSRGQMQRVAIARAICSGADAILADEPTGALDAENAVRVMKQLRDLAVTGDTPVVMVTHNRSLAVEYCTQILECKDGTLKPGPPTRDEIEAEERRAARRATAVKWKTPLPSETVSFELPLGDGTES